MSPIPVVRAAGTPYQRGLAIGTALADPIRRSAAYNLAHFERRGLDRARIAEIVGPLLEATELAMPAELDVLRGMANGAGLPLLDVLVPNAYEELDPHAAPGPWGARPVERCSALVVATPGGLLLGHNEQWLANEPGDVVLIVEIPEDPGEPPVVSPTVASWRPAVGMTAAGHAQAVMSLTAADDGPGVPRVLVSRTVLGAADPADALRRATPGGRSGGYAYLHAFRGGRACAIETTATRSVIVDGPSVHANHYLDPGLAAIGTAPSAGSLARYGRLSARVAVDPPATPEAVMAILADHASTPSAVCLHPDPRDGDDAESVVFAMVCDVEAGRIWVAPGRPCEAPFESFDVSDLVSGTSAAASPIGPAPGALR